MLFIPVRFTNLMDQVINGVTLRMPHVLVALTINIILGHAPSTRVGASHAPFGIAHVMQRYLAV